MKKKNWDINRIVENAETLNNPVIADCFFYGCEDYDGFNSVVDEIDELTDYLPDGINILDLPHTYCGNKKTKIFGLATCEATQGHRIFAEDAANRVFFEDIDDALDQGYRPCKRCMPEEYLEWERANKTREEMLEELSKITVAATPTVMTMDMGLEYDYITSEGAGTTFGCIGEWPAYKFHGIEVNRWRLIQDKVRDHSLTEEDLDGTDLGVMLKNLHNIYGDFFDDYYSDIPDTFASILDLPEVLPDAFYCLCDLRAWGDVPKFFITEKELQEAFANEYCVQVVKWEDIDDVEYWYDRLSDDLGGLAIIDYTELEDDEE